MTKQVMTAYTVPDKIHKVAAAMVGTLQVIASSMADLGSLKLDWHHCKLSLIEVEFGCRIFR